jgi:hypothetical protein
MLDPDRVLKEVNEIREKRKQWDDGGFMRGASIEEFITAMETEYSYLNSNAVTLFQKCINKDLDMNRLREMIGYLRQMMSGRSKEIIEKEIGEKLANRYVQPVLDKLEKDKNNK